MKQDHRVLNTLKKDVELTTLVLAMYTDRLLLVVVVIDMVVVEEKSTTAVSTM